MTIQLTDARVINGSVQAPGTQHTLSADFEAYLVQNGFATWVGGAPDVGGDTGVTTWRRNADGLVSLVGADGGSLITGLVPTGNDQTAEIQQYLNDTTKGSVFADFGAGEFIISGDLVVHARNKSLTEFTNGVGFGYGLNIRGVGPANTVLKDVRSNKSTPAILITDPTGSLVAKRNKMAAIRDFSLLACDPNGNPLTGQANLSGVGMASYAVVGTGYGAHVLHTGFIERVLFSGYQYPLTLDDTTQIEISRCAFVEFATAIRAGGNADIWDIHHCAFGSESFATPRNDAVAFDNTYSGPIGITGAGNNMKFRHCWVMNIGDFYTTAQTTYAPSSIEFEDVYFENVRRYFFAKDDSNVSPAYKVIFDKCNFSHMGTNDFASAVKGNANFGAKIQFGASNINTSASGGPVPYVTVKDCSGDIAPSNALIVFNNREGMVRWERNEIPENATYKHVRCIHNGQENWRSMKSAGYSDNTIHATLRNSQAGGLALENASVLRVQATIAAGATYNINHINGNLFELTLPDGNCTIDYAAYAAGPPSPLLAAGTEIDLVLIVPASITGTRTITWGPRVSMPAGTLAFTATEQGKRCQIKLRAPKDSGNVMQIVSRDPVFI